LIVPKESFGLLALAPRTCFAILLPLVSGATLACR